MKRILFFTHYLVGGGAEKTIANLSAYINENCHGYEAHIAIFFDDAEMHEKLSNVHVLPHKMPQGISKIKKIPVLCKQVYDLKKLKEELKIDTCISFLPGADFLNALSKGKEKMIVSVRNKESFFVKNKLRKWYIQFCYWKSDSIITVAERIKYDVINYFGVEKEKVQTIYNPVPHIRITGEVCEEYKKLLEQGKQIVITAGRLTEQKGQKYLIRAFEKVLKEIPNAHLVILGRGELEEMLKSLSKELGIEESVTFLGFVSNPHDYIREANVFVLSSIVEGIANILLETLVSNTAIVSTDCDSGPREILAPNTNYNYFTKEIEYAEYGVLIPVCDEKRMTEAVLRLLNDDELRRKYKDKARVRVADFSIHSIVQKWIECSR